MTRTFSLRQLGELLVKLVVVVVLTGMLAHAVQRVYTAGLQAEAGSVVSVNLKTPPPATMP